MYRRLHRNIYMYRPSPKKFIRTSSYICTLHSNDRSKVGPIGLFVHPSASYSVKIFHN